MSLAPFISSVAPTLAEAVDAVLAGGLSGREQRCLWCGASHLVAGHTDIWSGSITMRCASCGSELSGVAPRRLREVKR